jgi:hypothetical protein
MTTATLYNLIFKRSAEATMSKEYKLEQTQITRAIFANIRRTLTEKGLKYEFHFASRRAAETSYAEQAYMTPAALTAIQSITGIEKIIPMKVSLYPLSMEV